MEKNKEQLWKVEAIVEPEIEWEKIGIDSFKISADECVAFEKQLGNKTQLSITIVSDRAGVAEVHNKAHLVLKSFLSLLDLQAGRGYRPTISNASAFTKDGHAFVGNVLFGHFKAIPKLEDLDLSLLKTIANSLEILGADKRERVLLALNFLYDALATSSDVQCFISIYGAISYLMTSVGLQEKSLDTARETFSKFRDSGALTKEQEALLIGRFRQIHTKQYEVIKSNKVKRAELDEIKAFFKEFLVKYIEYAKLTHKEEC